MKIGIYDPYLDTLGGGERYMLTAAECLSKKNDVRVFWDDKEIINEAEKKFGLNLRQVTITKNIFSNNTLQISRIAKATVYDAVFYLSDGSIPTLPFTKTFIHFQAPLHKKNISTLTKVKLKSVKAVIVNSYYTKKYIDLAFGKNSTVIYPPVGVEEFSARMKKENIVMTVGRYSPIPGGDFKKHKEMIEVFKKIVDSKNKSWTFEMVISHLPEHKEKVAELKKRAAGYPINIHTDLTHTEIVELFGRAKIYWHAAGYEEDLEENPDRAEHFGIAVVEAMASGAVPIIYAAGGPQEIVEDKETGVLWTTTKELEASTLDLMKHESLRKEYKTKARQEAKFYAKERFCTEICNIFQ